jgi:DNA topoisomerase IB
MIFSNTLAALEKSLESLTETEAKRNIVAAVKEVALKLGNRPATCRKYYIHPAILDAYTNGEIPSPHEIRCRSKGLCRQETRILSLIRRFQIDQVVKGCLHAKTA